MPLRRVWLQLLAGVALACGEDATEPDLEVYRIAVTPTNTETLPDRTLSGCAQNLAPPDCTPEPLVTLTFD